MTCFLFKHKPLWCRVFSCCKQEQLVHRLCYNTL